MEILEWKEIAESFQDSILLGNGASISLCADFRYSSLFEKGRTSSCLSSGAVDVFERFDTTDFEMVLRLLRQAGIVNEALGIEEAITHEKHDEVRDGLVKTVRMIHAGQDLVRTQLPAVAAFLEQFTTVFSLNYDLLLYWTILIGNEAYGGRNRFKDCWLRPQKHSFGLFPDNYTWLRDPDDGLDECTCVFYPHGNLAFARDDVWQEWKLYSDEHLLLETVLSHWSSGYYRPLFVSEGESHLKLQAIRRSPYLKTVYERELKQTTNTLVIFGWSAGEQDSHILDAILNRKPRAIAIAVHDKSAASIDRWRTFANEVHRYRGAPQTEILLFDSESEGCWTKCTS